MGGNNWLLQLIVTAHGHSFFQQLAVKFSCRVLMLQLFFTTACHIRVSQLSLTSGCHNLLLQLVFKTVCHTCLSQQAHELGLLAWLISWLSWLVVSSRMIVHMHCVCTKSTHSTCFGCHIYAFYCDLPRFPVWYFYYKIIRINRRL